MWFSYDGLSFQTHKTEEEAKKHAEFAMDEWRDDACDGWDECSTQVCYGKVTHAVRVEEIEITDDNRHLLHPDVESLEEHHLERVSDGNN